MSGEADDDDDEAGLDEGMGPESPTGLDTEVDDDEPDDGDGDDPADVVARGGSISARINAPRAHRTISDTTRKLFAELAAKAKAADAEEDEDIDYDEVPVDLTKQSPAPAGTVAPGPGAPTPPVLPAGAAALAPPTPALDPEVTKLREEHTAKLADLTKREQALIAREQESDLGVLRETYIEHGAPAIVTMLKKWTGADGDALKDEIADLVTDLSANVLGIDVPSEIKERLKDRRAIKSIKHDKASRAEKEAASAKKLEAEQTKAMNLRVHSALHQEIQKPENATAYPFLAVEDIAGQIVFEVVENALAKGETIDWKEGARRANEYLATQWRTAHDKRRHLFNAAPAPAGGGTNGSKQRLQVDQPGSRRSQTQQQPPAPPATPPPSNGKWDYEAHRRQTKQRMRAAFAKQENDD